MLTNYSNGGIAEQCAIFITNYSDGGMGEQCAN